MSYLGAVVQYLVRNINNGVQALSWESMALLLMLLIAAHLVYNRGNTNTIVI